MAENTIKKLEDQLNCIICLDTYTDPKILQCFHIYCKQCLVKLVTRDQQGQLILTCPTCRQTTSVPACGVTGLQSAFQVTPLIEILEDHKKDRAAKGDVTHPVASRSSSTSSFSSTAPSPASMPLEVVSQARPLTNPSTRTKGLACETTLEEVSSLVYQLLKARCNGVWSKRLGKEFEALHKIKAPADIAAIAKTLPFVEIDK